MKKLLRSTSGQFIAALAFILVATSTAVHAQATLQDTTTSLQPQASQTQNATNTAISQTGAVQENTGQTVLSQTGTQALGVVSDPKQTKPQSVVQPSDTLKTEVPAEKKSSGIKYVIGGVVLFIAFIIFAIIVTSSPESERPKPAAKPITKKATKTVIIPELTRPITPKKKKQTRKQRQKHSAKK